MKKIKLFALCALMVVTMGLAVGCTSNDNGDKDNNSVTDGNNNDNNTNGGNNGKSGNGGVLDDIGDDIERGVDDMGNDLKNKTDGNGNSVNGNR